MALERSAAAKSAKSVFYEDFNDIDIYIEDTAEGYEKLYKELLMRVFTGVYRIKSIFPLGNRERVIDECEKNQTGLTRPSLFIIDGDLFLLTQDDPCKTKALNGLYVLPKYCVENVFVEEEAIVELMNEEDTRKDLKDLKIDFNFSGWLEANCEPLLNLFIEYAVSKRLTPHLKTVKYPLRHLVSSNIGEVDLDKINERIRTLKDAICAEVSDEEYLRTKDEIRGYVEFGEADFKKVVSGKDVLLPLVIMRVKSIVTTKISNINFKLRLAMKVNPACLSELHDYVLGS